MYICDIAVRHRSDYRKSDICERKVVMSELSGKSTLNPLNNLTSASGCSRELTSIAFVHPRRDRIVS